MLLSACLGGDGSGGNGSGASISCQPILQAERYRYSLSINLRPAATLASPDPSPGPAAPADPLDALAAALAQLISDMKMDGAYVSPDRMQIALQFGEEEVEMRSIGKKAWLRVGGDWQQVQDLPTESLLDPQELCGDLAKEIGALPKEVEPEGDTVNGMDVDHYRLDENETGLRSLPQVFGSAEDPPEQFSVDVWLVRDGHWPAKIRLQAWDSGGSGDGEMEFVLEFRDLNVEEVKVEPPPVSTQD